MDALNVWGESLDKRILVYNQQRQLVEKQLGELMQAKQGLDQFGVELQLEIEAFQSAKHSQKPVEAPYRSIPPLRASPQKVPVITQEMPQGELPDEGDFFAEEEEEAPTPPPRPQPVVARPPQVQKPQPIVPPEPVKGAFDSKALFARLK